MKKSLRAVANQWAVSTLAAASALLLQVQAKAQEASLPDAQEAFVLDAVQVTARRRPENAMTVPLAASTLNAKDMDELGVTGFDRVGQTVPNLVVHRRFGSGSGPLIFLRGLESGTISLESDIRAGTYLDDVYLGRLGAMSAFTLPDLCGMETLRGPQGTLFGGNAAAGVIRLASCEPSGHAGASLKLGAGNYGQHLARATLESGRWGGLSARLLVQTDWHEGWTRNAAPGVVTRLSEPFGTLVSAQDLGRSRNEAQALALRYEPDKHWRFNYRFDRSTSRDSQVALQLLALYGGIAALYDPAVGAGGVLPSLTRQDSVPEDFTGTDRRRLDGHSLTAEYRWNPGLSLKYIVSTRHFWQRGGGNDLDGAALNGRFLSLAGIATADDRQVCYFCGLNDAGLRETAHELRLLAQWEAWDLTAGLFAFRESGHWNAPVLSGAAFEPGAVHEVGSLSRLLPSDYVAGRSVEVVNQTFAAYLHANYRISEQWTLGTGLRQTHDLRRTDTLRSARGPGVDHLGFAYADGEASLRYSPVQELDLYARLASAHVSGGVLAAFPFAAEFNRGLEFGLKSLWAGRRIRADLAVFHNRSEHQQLQQFRADRGTYILDGGSSTQSGWETELQGLVTRDLSLHASYGRVNARFDNGLKALTPKQTLYVGGELHFQPLANGIRPLLRMDATWQDRALPAPCLLGQAATPMGCSGTGNASLTQAVTLPARTDLSLRLTLDDIAWGRLVNGTLSVWMRNALGRRQLQFARDLGNGTVMGSFADPRTFGVELTLSL